MSAQVSHMKNLTHEIMFSDMSSNGIAEYFGAIFKEAHNCPGDNPR